MGISINGGTPQKWLVIRENPIKMDDVGGGTPILGNPHMVFDGQMAINALITQNQRLEVTRWELSMRFLTLLKSSPAVKQP